MQRAIQGDGWKENIYLVNRMMYRGFAFERSPCLESERLTESM